LKNPTLLVRADASTAIGSGHVMRCLALAKAWQKSGGRACFLMAESIPALEPRLARDDVELARLAAEPASQRDAEQTANWARRSAASWLVVDGYRFAPDYIRGLKTSGLRVLHVDDDGRWDRYEADIVLNQDINANSEMYIRAPDTRLLLGADYVLLRPEFLAEPRDREIPAMARNILVTMGGSDPENVTEKILTALSGMVDLDFAARIVVGGGNPHFAALQPVAEKLAGKVRLERGPANMAHLMSWADITISAAGGTCWELAFVGVPTILVVITPDQNPNASAISAQGAALSLGWHANLSSHQIDSALRNLIKAEDQRRKMSERGRRLVDGQGAERVVASMQRSLNAV